RRWIFLARALPEVVPGVRYRESHLGLALSELSHVENLPQRVPIVFAAGLIAGAGVGLGLLVIRALGLARELRWTERIPLAFGLGMAGRGLITLGRGRMGWLQPWPVRVGLGVLMVVGWAMGRGAKVAGESSPSPRPSPPEGRGGKSADPSPREGRGGKSAA